MILRRMILTMVLLLTAATLVRAENWPGFRGPRGDGTCVEKGLPLTWSATENVAWKVAIPGKGHSSPVVWKDRLFVTTCVEESDERVLLCLDRRTGKTLWQRTALKSPLEGIHPLNSRASSTPATDGERVYVSFLDQDKMFLAAFDFNGNKLWEARPGPFSSKHGYCSSPVLYKDKVIVNGDHDGNGYLVALNRKTGAIEWKTPRPNQTRSYCTPLIRNVGGRPLLMMSGSKCIAAYNPDTGVQRWLMDGPTEQFVAAPVYDGKLLFITTGYPDKHILAIHPEGEGKLSDSAIAWRTRRGCSYVPSPVVTNGYFFIVADGGFASCFDAANGDLKWSERLGGGHSASILTAEDRLYCVSDRGVTTILRAGPVFEKLAENPLGEDCFASPIASQGQVFIRTVDHLWAIGKGEAH
jgi:outer membrane protein assembly factor BamB